MTTKKPTTQEGKVCWCEQNAQPCSPCPTHGRQVKLPTTLKQIDFHLEDVRKMSVVEHIQQSALNRIAIYIKEGKTVEANALAEFIGIDLNTLSSKDKDGKLQKEN